MNNKKIIIMVCVLIFDVVCYMLIYPYWPEEGLIQRDGSTYMPRIMAFFMFILYSVALLLIYYYKNKKVALYLALFNVILALYPVFFVNAGPLFKLR